jgi:8-oxo-dGTP diphosphatase
MSLQGPAALTENEQRLGMQMNWMSLDEAIARLQHWVSSDEDFSTKFMLLRDLTILELTSLWLNEEGRLKNDG